MGLIPGRGIAVRTIVDEKPSNAISENFIIKSEVWEEKFKNQQSGVRQRQRMEMQNEEHIIVQEVGKDL